MNLHTMLLEREAVRRPVTVGLIGAGKFGTMFAAQARLTRGMRRVAVADLDLARAERQLAAAGWPEDAFAAASLEDALKSRRAHVTDDAEAVIASPGIEVIVEATGTEGEIDALVALLRGYGIKELVRTGAVVMLRGAGSIEEALKP